MKVFIAGATGVLGRRLVRDFRSRGHAVVGLARTPEGRRMVESLGGEARTADLFDAEAIARAAVGADVVIRAATAIPSKVRASRADWRMNDRIRREGTMALTTAAAKVGARHYLQESVTWVARPADGSAFDEETPPNPNLDPILRSALDGERIAMDAGERSGLAVSALRLGFFYSPDSRHIRSMGAALRRRKMPIMGRGDAPWSMIHVDDASRAFVAAAGTKRTGTWHVVDDQPVSMAEFLRTFAEKLGTPAPRRIPLWVARLATGRYLANLLTTSTRTSNHRFRRDFDWRPGFPTYREGLDHIVATWIAEGMPTGRGSPSL